MIDRPLITPDGHSSGLGGVTVDFGDTAYRDAYSVENADGSVDVYLEGLEDELKLIQAPFDANLAEYLPENTLSSLVQSIS